MKIIAICLSCLAFAAPAVAAPLILDDDHAAVYRQHILDRGELGDAAQKFHVAERFDHGDAYFDRSKSKAADWYRRAATSPVRNDADFVIVLRARAALRRLDRAVPAHKSDAFERRAERYAGAAGWQVFLDDFSRSPEADFRAGQYADAYQRSRQRMAYVDAASELGMPDAERAAEFGNHAWFSLFAYEYEESLETALDGLALDATQLWIWTNVAHALLLQGNVDEARFTYKAYLGEPIGDDKAAWGVIIAQDFAMMKAAGLPGAHMSDILDELQL